MDLDSDCSHYYPQYGFCILGRNGYRVVSNRNTKILKYVLFQDFSLVT